MHVPYVVCSSKTGIPYSGLAVKSRGRQYTLFQYISSGLKFKSVLHVNISWLSVSCGVDMWVADITKTVLLTAVTPAPSSTEPSNHTIIK